ncbi:MAG: hypothetical protein JSR67_15180 [Proteobacteria bacterium]|nr:hypothetical protein [Pseudomonadota bacterium]
MPGSATRKHPLLASSLAAAIGIGACSSKMPPTATPAAQPFHPTATIQELMEEQVDPSADALWDSVAIIESQSGTEDRHPRTDAEWHAVRTRAVTLIEATNLLSIPGRRVRSGEAAGGPGELPPAEIQRRIDASPDTFVRFAGVLQEAARQALVAIDARNAQGLMDAGAVIDVACESCHLTYWYPDQRRR